MGRGKKKGGGNPPPKTETPDLSTLSLAETPTTSTVSTEPKSEEPAEESEGLGLSLKGKGRNRRKKNKDQSDAQSQAAPQASTSAAVTAEPLVSQAISTQPSAQQSKVVKSEQTCQSTAASQIEPVLATHSTISPTASAPSHWSQPAVGRGRGVGRGAGRGADPGHGFFPRPTPTNVMRPQTAPVAQQKPTSSVQQFSTPPVQQLSKTSSQATTKSSYTQICRFKIPPKYDTPVRSVMSHSISVITNYLAMRIQAKKIFRYDVAIKPERPKKMMPQAFMEAKKIHFPNSIIAFDQQKNCYALQALPKVPANDRFTTTVELSDSNGKLITFEVSFKQTGIVDLQTIIDYMTNKGTSLNPPTEAIQCVDVILRQGTLESYVKAGRQFFLRPEKPLDLGLGLEMWTGLFQSAIFTSRAFLNVDVAHKGFPRQQNMVDALINDFRLDPSRPIEQQRGRIDAFEHFLKGLRVVAAVGGDKKPGGLRREFICNKIAEPANRLKFTVTDAQGKQQTMTVADYFVKVKQCRLKYPNLNCLWVGPRDKNIYYPMELLEVACGQVLNKQLNESQLSEMVKTAAAPPHERKQKIEEVIRSMDYSRKPFFKQFGLELSNDFVEVPAKVLQPPKLDVGSNRTVDPSNGSWRANQLLKASPLESWGFIGIEVDARAANAEYVVTQLMDNGRQMGMQVTQPKMTRCNVRIQELNNVLFSALQAEVRFLVIVVSGRGRDYYHRVKRVAELDVGILTQCIKEFTASRKMNPQTARNILLKVNAKLMGINQGLSGVSMPRCLKAGGVMVVGADVTHPSPDQNTLPSIAAVTASIDPKCFQYHIELSVQSPKKEIIDEFEDIMVDHLKVYAKYQKSLPTKIYVFRDGVSEGQFAQVLNNELQAIYNAYQRMTGKPQKPEVLFLVVQKRHHTRLFLKAGSRIGNVDPGTVVDKEIVHASEMDFYLVSHQAIKGTARPTRYHAICNDGEIPQDEVEQLTYYLCHLYSRCMRAVSYPTPTYYAHLACLRARTLTFGDRFNNNELDQKPKRLRIQDKVLQFSRMFFV